MKKREVRRREVELQELEAILERARQGALSSEDHDKLRAAVDTLAVLTRELETKGTSILRLRRLVFGPGTEKTSRVLGDADGVKHDSASSAEADGSSDVGHAASSEATAGEGAQAKHPGHGRNGAAAYHGADKVKVEHGALLHGAGCPSCSRGKVYLQKEPASLLRIKGMAPMQASVYELERLRCNTCGTVFTAEAPEGVGTAKYDETATAMIALLKYGCGLPFYRLEKLENTLGIPLPSSTQWGLVQGGAAFLDPVHREYIRQGAQGEVVYNDDTAMKILDFVPPEPEKGSEERTGVFTSGIVAIGGDQRIALFFTGNRHAGENLERVLKERARDLSPPIQMCDALSWNTCGAFETIVSNCLAHARRQYVDVAGSFPEECRYVLESLRDVYHHDALAREGKMSKEERLAFHQEQSAPIMERLEGWLREQIEERRVEPNSGLGEAITYMRKHWERLTLFLRKAGAPLDNTICERALKRAVLHRKNALFYKTENGARVGDLYMSLIHTAELAGEDPFDYLVTLLRNPRPVERSPADWMPWNYRESLKRIASGASPPA